MTTATNGIAVVATQIARTDRRALSQAWYSALHLAHGASLTPALPTARRAVQAPAIRRGTAETAAPPRAIRGAQSAPARALRRERTGALPLSDERRRPACAVARSVEQAVAALRARVAQHASQTIDVAGGRVRLLVRCERGTTRIVALCSDDLRAPVERALAHARFTLAGAGVPGCVS